MSPVILNGSAPTATNGHGAKRGHTDGFGTRVIHAGSAPNKETGAVIPPISLSTTYKQDAIGKHKVSSAGNFLQHFCGVDGLATPLRAQGARRAVQVAPSPFLSRDNEDIVLTDNA